jgi:hypothetical protein
VKAKTGETVFKRPGKISPASYRLLYIIVFFVGAGLGIIAYLGQDDFSFILAAIASFFSFVIYVTIMIRKKKIGYIVYIPIWVIALLFSVLSILNKNYISLAILIVVMFLASMIAYGLSKRIKKQNIYVEVEKIRRTKKRIETDMDVLLELLREHGKLKLSEIAIAFDLDLETAEEWCKILDEHEFATIHYPAFGEIELALRE